MEEYIVTEQTRKLWAVELDLLEQFKKLCAKHGLRYYALAGTLLGAVRHKGFIPWDDDIDVAMPWEDCQKLMEIAPREVSFPYYFQSHLTEKNGEISNFRFRRSDTTGCTRWEYENMADPEYNRGIFMDIFPLFNVPPTEEERLRQKELVMDAWKAFRGYTALEGAANGLKNVNPEYAKYIDIYKEYSKRYSVLEIKKLYFDRCAMQKEPTDQVAITAYRVNDPVNMWKSEWFRETVELPFEGTTVTAPKGYIQWLDHRYGDWRTPVYNAAGHEMFLFDADVPYTEKLGLKKP